MYCHVLLMTGFWKIFKRPSGLGVLLDSKGSLVRFPTETCIFILKFSLISLHHSSVRLGKVIVLRRISDYGYITAPLQSPFTTRCGYGGRILDLNPGVLTGGSQLGRTLAKEIKHKYSPAVTASLLEVRQLLDRDVWVLRTFKRKHLQMSIARHARYLRYIYKGSQEINYTKWKKCVWGFDY